MTHTDREALAALYHATDGPNWKNKTNWGSGAPLSDWYGVTANDQGRVVKLSLNWNNLRGHIPQQLENLSGLESLDLSWNKLDGRIPVERGGLNKLKELELSGNQLTGPIPPELGNLRELQMLLLYKNQLTGSIPQELGALTELQKLWLDNNQLAGHIPPQLRNLSALETLDLSFNKLDARASDAEIEPKVFFSHTQQILAGESGSNAAFLVEVVTNILATRGVKTFYDVNELRPKLGIPLAPEIAKEVVGSSVFIAILTPAFSQRFWPMRELQMALESGRHVVPVLFGTTFDDLVENFENFDPMASWPDREGKEEVIKSSVENLKKLSELNYLTWSYVSFDKTNIKTFGELLAERVEDIVKVHHGDKASS